LLTLKGGNRLPRSCDGGGGIVVDDGVHTGLDARLSTCDWPDSCFGERESSDAGFEVGFSTSAEDMIVSADDALFRLRVADDQCLMLTLP
jgi:hypothetical protein